MVLEFSQKNHEFQSFTRQCKDTIHIITYWLQISSAIRILITMNTGRYVTKLLDKQKG